MQQDWIEKNKTSQPTPKAELSGTKVTFGYEWVSYQGMIHLEFLKHSEKLNVHLFVQQLQHVHKILVENCPVVVNRKKCYPSL